MPDDREQAHDVLAAEEFGMPSSDPALADRRAHDVLAAEEFGMPTTDSRLAGRRAHDVLAAEEFGVPAPDPGLRLSHVPLALPRDPKDPDSSRPPHDVLAADEFAMPATEPRALSPGHEPDDTSAGSPLGGSRFRIAALFLAMTVLWLRWRRRGPA